MHIIIGKLLLRRCNPFVMLLIGGLCAKYNFWHAIKSCKTVECRKHIKLYSRFNMLLNHSSSNYFVMVWIRMPLQLCRTLANAQGQREVNTTAQGSNGSKTIPTPVLSTHSPAFRTLHHCTAAPLHHPHPCTTYTSAPPAPLHHCTHAPLHPTKHDISYSLYSRTY